MDIVAHGWWMGVGLGVAAWAGHTVPSRRTLGLTLGLALAPDLVHLLPVALGERVFRTAAPACTACHSGADRCTVALANTA
mgnify:CR=1 FL=1